MGKMVSPLFLVVLLLENYPKYILMTLLAGSKVNDRCPLGYLLYFRLVLIMWFSLLSWPQDRHKNNVGGHWKQYYMYKNLWKPFLVNKNEHKRVNWLVRYIGQDAGLKSPSCSLYFTFGPLRSAEIFSEIRKYYRFRFIYSKQFKYLNLIWLYISHCMTSLL